MKILKALTGFGEPRAIGRLIGRSEQQIYYLHSQGYFRDAVWKLSRKNLVASRMKLAALVPLFFSLAFLATAHAQTEFKPPANGPVTVAFVLSDGVVGQAWFGSVVRGLVRRACAEGLATLRELVLHGLVRRAGDLRPLQPRLLDHPPPDGRRQAPPHLPDGEREPQVRDSAGGSGRARHRPTW